MPPVWGASILGDKSRCVYVCAGRGEGGEQGSSHARGEACKQIKPFKLNPRPSGCCRVTTSQAGGEQGSPPGALESRFLGTQVSQAGWPCPQCRALSACERPTCNSGPA